MPVDKGFHWSVDARNSRLAANKASLPYRGPFFSKVVSALPEQERVTIDTFLGQKTIAYAYAFASTNAWIRGQPEPATTVLTVIGGDTNDMQPINYYDATKAAAATKYAATARGLRSNPSSDVPKTQPYRVLSSGDIDMGSRNAQTFMGLRDVHQTRGGLSHFLMTSLKATVETPLFQVHGPAHTTQFALNDEMRYGTVRRAGVFGTATSPALVRGLMPSVRNPLTQPFAKEWSVSLDWFGAPAKLIDHRQGNVYEDDGVPAQGRKTGLPLRGRWRWFTLSSETRAEVDEGGNFLVSSALEATDGGTVQIPTGSFFLDVGQSTTLRSNFDTAITASLGKFTATGKTGFRVSTPAGGEIEATLGLDLKSIGTVRVMTPMPMGIQLGTELELKYPVLVGHPLYLSTLNAWLSSEAVLDGLLGTYGVAAAQAWAAIGPLTMLLDPTGVVAGLCAAAATAAGAIAAAAPTTNAALAAHMPTQVPMPAGFLSSRTISG